MALSYLILTPIRDRWQDRVGTYMNEGHMLLPPTLTRQAFDLSLEVTPSEFRAANLDSKYLHLHGWVQPTGDEFNG